MSVLSQTQKEGILTFLKKIMNVLVSFLKNKGGFIKSSSFTTTVEINALRVAVIFIRSSEKRHLYRHETVSYPVNWTRTLERPFQVLRNKWQGTFPIFFEI